MNFVNKVVLITGAANGIGRSLGIAYADAAAKVILLDKDEQGLKETQSLISNKTNVYSFISDISNPQEIDNVVQKIFNTIEKIDILINNAGIGIPKSPLKITVEEWDKVINTNLRGTFICSREVAKRMKESGGGSIVNIASTRALMSEPDSEAYAASKGGILSLTHALAISLGKYKIRVNAITPGWIATKDYEKLSKKDHQQHPAGRVGKMEDIASACFYLTDEKNDFVTGTNLIVDGGMTRKMIYEE